MAPAPLPSVSGTKPIGLEQSHRTSYMTGHILWQDRLGIERSARNKQLAAWYRQIGMHPETVVEPALGLSPELVRWRETIGPGGRASTALHSRAFSLGPSASKPATERPAELVLRPHEITGRTWRLVSKLGVEGAAPQLPTKYRDGQRACEHKGEPDTEAHNRTAAIVTKRPRRLSHGQLAPFARAAR
mmetsp:Transcript_60635/g.141256  ORF Transcript_60635/g.141256 Transcript_60635/m.141256 type:complete len:188 (+) Transcript_60635:201-764(+)